MSFPLSLQILLSESGTPKLADFGCSCLIDTSKTSTSSTKGTMRYMVPPQAPSMAISFAAGIM